MKRIKAEIIVIIILIPILAYVGWQVYNSYFKPPEIDLEELEEPEALEEKPAPARPLEPEIPPAPKGTLNYTGYIQRDPLEHSLPVKIKEEKPPAAKVPEREELKPVEKKPPKEIILPKFTVTGIVWGKTNPRAIIDHKVYKIGDIIKGAKILNITQQGIQMIYEEKEFWVTISEGG